MTQEQKELLIKDLCARLPYKPIVQIDDCGVWDLRGIDHDDSAELRDRVIVWHGKNYPSSKNSFPIMNCKPFLFPLSSMTEEQKEELNVIFDLDVEVAITHIKNGTPNLLTGLNRLNWFIKNHFDIYGLIPMGLAIDATGKNIY